MLAGLWAESARGEEALDWYGGIVRVAGQVGPSFHLEKIGQRWWLVTPEGHGIIVRAVSKVDVADYLTADPDSPLHFEAAIESLRWDAASGCTIVTAPDLRYVFRLAHFVTFPDCRELMEKGTCGGKYVYGHPRVKWVRWNTLGVPGDFTAGVRPGMHVAMWKSDPSRCRTQEDRAAAMKQLYESLLQLRGDDGMGFVIGTEHWSLYDPAVSNWCDNQNFGLATLQDNAYDGVEARRKTGKDARGYPVGGEDADYGNLLGPLGQFLRGLDERVERAK